MNLPSITRTERVASGLYLIHFDNGGVVEADRHNDTWRVMAFSGPIWMDGGTEWAKSLREAKSVATVVASVVVREH